MAYVIKLFDASRQEMWRGLAAQLPTKTMKHELWQQGYRYWSTDNGTYQSLEGHRTRLPVVSEPEDGAELKADYESLFKWATYVTGIPALLMWLSGEPGLQLLADALVVVTCVEAVMWGIITGIGYIRDMREAPAAREVEPQQATSSFFTQQGVVELSEYQQDMLAWSVDVEATLRSPFKRMAGMLLLGYEAAPTALGDWFALWGDQAYQLARDITEDAELYRLYEMATRLNASTSRGVYSYVTSLKQTTQLSYVMVEAAKRVHGYYHASQQVAQAAIDALGTRPELER